MDSSRTLVGLALVVTAMVGLSAVAQPVLRPPLLPTAPAALRTFQSRGVPSAPVFSTGLNCGGTAWLTADDPNGPCAQPPADTRTTYFRLSPAQPAAPLPWTGRGFLVFDQPAVVDGSAGVAVFAQGAAGVARFTSGWASPAEPAGSTRIWLKSAAAHRRYDLDCTIQTLSPGATTFRMAVAGTEQTVALAGTAHVTWSVVTADDGWYETVLRASGPWQLASCEALIP